ncbi:Hsp20/alpha crystallin family protein [Elusimicrobiota bacterium]
MRYLAIREPGGSLREFDRFFYSLFDDYRRSMKLFDSAFTGENLQVKEEKDRYVISGKLEGFKKKDIKVNVDDNVLYVKAENKTEDEKSKEASYRSYSRVLYLGDNVDIDKIKASFKKEDLSITLPKTKETEKKVTHITVE